ncbi:MAG: OmpA family protein, partial [Ignavibacteriota bacterium]
MARYTAHIFFFILFSCCAHLAYATPIPKDSIVYRDTLIEERTIEYSRPKRIGVGGSLGWNFYRDQSLPSSLSSQCDTFKTGHGNGLNFFGRLEFPIGGKEGMFHFSPVLSFEDLSADHTWGEFGTARDSSGTLHRVQFDHIITNTTKAIGLRGMFGWQFLHFGNLEAGPAFLFLFDQNYSKLEKAITNDLILTPEGPVQQLSEGSGILPEAKSFLLGFSMSLGAELPLPKILKGLSVEPNLEFLFPITQSTSYWSHTSIRGGLTFHYDLDSPADTLLRFRPERIPVHIEIPENKEPSLSASIDAVVINRNGQEEHIVRMEVEEVRVHYAYPMLNYIFFDDGSSQIPPRYNQYQSYADAQRDFRPSLDRNTKGLMQLYRQTLNILGERLRRSSEMKIKITGCSSNTGIEAGNIELSRKRAEAVAEYFERVWQIDPKRMKIEARLLPEKPSPSNIRQGQEENRRVEITSNDESLTDPLVVPRTEHIANPPNISLVPHIRSDTGIQSYQSTISIGGLELVTFNGSELKPWSVPEEALSSGVDSLDIFLKVIDNAGNMVTAHNSIKLEQKHIDREQQQELEKFSLILFAFDESVLGTKNERTLNLVAESSRKARPRNLTIVGFTDELGDAGHNDELSRRRALEASAELERSLRTKGLVLPPNVLIDGKGSRELLYDNTLPEGRFFSRTVNITLDHG